MPTDQPWTAYDADSRPEWPTDPVQQQIALLTQAVGVLKSSVERASRGSRYSGSEGPILARVDQLLDRVRRLGDFEDLRLPPELVEDARRQRAEVRREDLPDHVRDLLDRRDAERGRAVHGRP